MVQNLYYKENRKRLKFDMENELLKIMEIWLQDLRSEKGERWWYWWS